MPALPAEQLVAVVAAFVSAALLVGLAASRLLAGQSLERRRLRGLSQPSHSALVEPSAGVTRPAGTPGSRRGGWVPKSVRDMSRVERRLATAGYRSAAAARIFVAAELLCPALVGLAALAAFGWTTERGLVAAGFGVVVGHMLPGFYVDRQVATRRLRIRNGLPDFLDLLIVCLEAGSSLDQAVVKASEELALAYPALAEELRVLSTETRAGKPRLEAFRNLAQRTRVEDVRALVAMLVQTDRFGTSVAQALRTLATDMRTKRRQAAEEAANKVGVKLVFPLVLCLFPAFFVVVLGPAFLKLMRALAQAGR